MAVQIKNKRKQELERGALHLFAGSTYIFGLTRRTLPAARRRQFRGLACPHMVGEAFRLIQLGPPSAQTVRDADSYPRPGELIDYLWICLQVYVLMRVFRPKTARLIQSVNYLNLRSKFQPYPVAPGVKGVCY